MVAFLGNPKSLRTSRNPDFHFLFVRQCIRNTSC
jgi:hypothetical protein